jgi:hypothetical protein
MTYARPRRAPSRYGTACSTAPAPELVRAVSSVLTAAGLRIVDLDEEFSATKSADLLVSAGGPPRRLVEVKAASGAAQEHLVGHLQRHLDTWPQLRPELPVTGGVLVVNHQHKLHPSERTAHVYSRPEFVAALPVTVLTTVDLFRWWRAADWTSIRAAVLSGAAAVLATAPRRLAEAGVLSGDTGARSDGDRRGGAG